MSKHTPQQLHADDANRHHQPVLLHQVVGLLRPMPGESYLDLTAGYGGHAQAIADRLGGWQAVTLVDRDEHAISELKIFQDAGAQVIHDDFAHFAEVSAEQGTRYNMVLVDFGVSSPQLDRAERGFSIARPGPLDMRMDQRQELNALTMVNRMPKWQLAEVIEKYGEERPRVAARIALAIVQSRPLSTTEDLSRAVLSTHRGPRTKVHPATRTFQAIRIACNDELRQIERLLTVLPEILHPEGRVAFISFHSLEDRLVKNYLREQSQAGYEAEFSLIGKPILGKLHDVHNPRARSAILRAAVKK